jgi:hypothetical protein
LKPSFRTFFVPDAIFFRRPGDSFSGVASCLEAEEGLLPP